MAANAVNEFGQQLVSEWRPLHANDNLIFSPLSIAVCFMLVYNGARSRTKTELETVFGFEDETVTSNLASKLTKYSGASVAKMANRIYVEKTITLKEDFMASVGLANVESSNFANAFEEVRGEINAWVSGRTAGLIPNLIPLGVLSANTVLVAVNALYFKGMWQTRFPAEGTESGIFHGVGSDQTVPFMTQRGTSFRVKEVAALDSILFAMPYEGGAFTMYVLLPNEQNGWKTAEESLPAQIGSLFGGGFTERTVDTLKIPKWEMELSLEPLNNIMINLGLSTAFSFRADFSGITEDTALAISEVIHKARIIVDEEGTEAAAATAIIFEKSAALPFEILVDHPFLYFIVDEADGTVLFQGTQTRI